MAHSLCPCQVQFSFRESLSNMCAYGEGITLGGWKDDMIENSSKGTDRSRDLCILVE